MEPKPQIPEDKIFPDGWRIRYWLSTSGYVMGQLYNAKGHAVRKPFRFVGNQNASETD